MSSVATGISREKLLAGIARFANKQVLILGDVILDAYLVGDAERISPEAPVPVVRILSRRQVLGGAGNVASNIQALGGKAHIVGVCGDDAPAAMLAQLFHGKQITTDLIPLRGRPTTVKTRIVAQQQQMLRFDEEENSVLGAEALDTYFVKLEKIIAGYAVIVISDYGKGLISSVFMERLHALLQAKNSAAKVLVDPKTPNYPAYTNTFLLTPNAKEASECSGLATRTNQEIFAAGKAICTQLACENVLITLGGNGMALFQQDGSALHIPTMARDVFDVTGAGDTVVGVTALGLAAGLDLLYAVTLANYAAGIVVGHSGAAIAEPEALRQVIATLPLPCVSNWV